MPTGNIPEAPQKDTSPQWTHNGGRYGVHHKEGGFTIFLLFAHHQVGLDVMQKSPHCTGCVSFSQYQASSALPKVGKL